METKVKGDKIKEGSIPLSALSDSTYNIINNVLFFDDEYEIDLNTEYSEGSMFFLINDYSGSHIKHFKNYLYNLVKYHSMGGIKFSFAGDPYSLYYLPFMRMSASKEVLSDIANNDFSNIDVAIDCYWGVALDDANNLSMNIGLKLLPKQNKLYLKVYEI